MAFTSASFAQANLNDPPQAPPPPPSAANPAIPPQPHPMAPNKGPKLVSLPIGSDIPNPGFIMPNSLGEPASLETLKKDKGLLVLFISNSCPIIANANNRMLEMMKIAARLNVGVALINSNEGNRQGEDGPEKMQAFGMHMHYTAPYLMDNMSIIADQFGAIKTPEAFLFDAQGKLVYKGALMDNQEDAAKSKKFFVLEAINNMVAGKPVKPQMTKVSGCEIKRQQM